MLCYLLMLSSTTVELARKITSSLSKTSPPLVPLSTNMERGISKIRRIGGEVVGSDSSDPKKLGG